MEDTMRYLALGFLGGSLLWSTVATCLRFRPALIPIILLADFLVLLTRSPIAFILWKLCFFYTACRWYPLRGLFRLPRWPRVHQRGRGGRRPREFGEPLPWFRGPGTY